MRLLLFNLVATLTGALIGANMAVGHALAILVSVLCNGLSFAMRAVGERLMLWIDADRYEYACLANSQAGDLLELGLLVAANKIKDDAVKTRTWTVHHTQAINEVAAELQGSCGWEAAKIHGYLRPLIESTGLGYSTGEDMEGTPTA